jgi:hypothetical protein
LAAISYEKPAAICFYPQLSGQFSLAPYFATRDVVNRLAFIAWTPFLLRVFASRQILSSIFTPRPDMIGRFGIHLQRHAK